MWVSVDERLPDIEQDVLLTDCDRCFIGYIESITMRKESKSIEWKDSEYDTIYPTHWQELPKLPKKSKD